jgi:hypothetical protein
VASAGLYHEAISRKPFVLHVALHRNHSGTHPAYWAAAGNTRTAESAVNQKITDEREATRIARVKGSNQFEVVAEGTKITSQRALATTYHSSSG